MPKIIKQGQVVDDPRQIIDDEQTLNEPASAIVSLDRWLTLSNEQQTETGVLLAADTDVNSLDNQVLNSPVIAIDFPTFMDGRGFSIARIIREQKQYTGELRAVGYVIRDQLCYLARCGFTAFELNDTDLDDAIQSLDDFTEFYQVAVYQTEPLFRRRVAN